MLSVFRVFCASSQVLTHYAQCTCYTSKELCRVFKKSSILALRTESQRTPDHMHKERVSAAFVNTKTLAEMLLRTLGSKKDDSPYAMDVLEIHHNKLFVKQNMLEAWQCEVTAHQSTVPFIAATWESHDYLRREDLQCTAKRIFKTLQYATLPSISDNRLHSLIQSDDGMQGNLHDLHIHFSGTTECSLVWLHTLENRYEVLASLLKEYARNVKVQQFYKQCDTNPRDIFSLVCRAIRIREYMCRLLPNCQSYSSTNDALKPYDIYNALSGANHDYPYSSQHPFRHSTVPSRASTLQREGIMWLHVLRHLRETGNHYLAMLAHAYILLTNQYIRLLVQQRDQFGFDQFQYITLMGAREPLEDKNTQQRFTQFYGMYGPDLAHVEARFAPKDDYKKTIKLLEAIWDGYTRVYGQKNSGITPCAHCPKIAQQFIMCDGQLIKKSSLPPHPTMGLGLVAHFIKEADDSLLTYRHQRLRLSLYQKASALVQARKYLEIVNPDLFCALVGKDAASNELEASPEVFAPVFRYLNYKGVCKSTYHAGEDFPHILSGMRAVHEAILFLDLRSGDRIGHATALGLNPEYGEMHRMHCSQGHWLDTLIWLTWLLATKATLKQYIHEIAAITLIIHELYHAIYRERSPDLPILWRAWRMRNIDITRLHGVPLPSYAHALLESRLVEDAQKDEIAFQVFQKYHNKNFRTDYDKSISLENAQLSIPLLRLVQDTIIHEMRESNIIVEVLPTSNVRISHYDITEEHHVLRWLDEEDTRPAPQVVIGTDDPGIFSTNLRTEYALLLHYLQKKYASSAEKPYQIIRHLIKNGQSYRFRNDTR